MGIELKIGFFLSIESAASLRDEVPESTDTFFFSGASGVLFVLFGVLDLDFSGLVSCNSELKDECWSSF